MEFIKRLLIACGFIEKPGETDVMITLPITLGPGAVTKDGMVYSGMATVPSGAYTVVPALRFPPTQGSSADTRDKPTTVRKRTRADIAAQRQRKEDRYLRYLFRRKTAAPGHIIAAAMDVPEQEAWNFLPQLVEKGYAIRERCRTKASNGNIMWHYMLSPTMRALMEEEAGRQAVEKATPVSTTAE